MSTREVGRRIRRLRSERGLAQREVAEPVLTAAYLSLIESGQRFPSDSVLAHIAERLGVTTDELVTGRSADLYARLELTLQEARARIYNADIPAAHRELEQLRSEARRYRLTRLEARAVIALAAIQERTGSVSDAADAYEQARVLLNDEAAHVRFEAVVGYALSVHRMGDSRVAAHTLERYLLELADEGVVDPTAKMRTLSALVPMYKAIGHERRAVEAAEEAINLSAHVQDPEQIACMNMNVARALLEQGRHQDALDALRSAERLYEQLGWPLLQVRSQINRGIVEANKGELEAARVTFGRIVEMLSDFPEQLATLAEVLNELGRVERLLGDDEAAISTLRRARKLLSENDALEMALNRRELGQALTKIDSNKAERELRRSAAAFQAADSYRDAGESLLALGRLFRVRGEVDKAARVLEQGLELTTKSPG